MFKNFYNWFKIKTKINNGDNILIAKEREIIMCHLGLNVGFEQDGSGDSFLRPVLIFKKFSNKLYIIIPLTKKHRTGKFYFTFSFNKKTQSTAILSQLKIIDSKRFIYKMGYISKEDFDKIKDSVFDLLYSK
ncbi:MAG TPA: type II toxin-antitoxin system PemK/MazF family toxin [Candidatus Paceibacterota bacterium]|nr:type II toxin-antitoxin system PemK/MazF family toxin [Candidatus Paceibacterota bacterium]HMP19222.1 type II toxin-antitoxin system PemK/MazF family toxin [Candidatus Paceibacterota bacterium]